ncbi:uncharacterized protein METZ01_LOCUS42494 [marine metagenome]|uniref:Uncharacterized protein n=1 Tax=marine metagenome TaxID=408172 RepID=A0A381RD99_9ZZZZ
MIVLKKGVSDPRFLKRGGTVRPREEASKITALSRRNADDVGD